MRFGDPDTVEDLRSALAGMDGSYNHAEASLRCDLAHAIRHLARDTTRALAILGLT